jgi:hypothetical protein
MFFLHGHPATPTTDKFHGRQFIFAHMGVADIVSPAKTAFGFITTGVT